MKTKISLFLFMLCGVTSYAQTTPDCVGADCCSIGTFYDLTIKQCVIEHPTDVNFDGCVDLNDLLDLLATYGMCFESTTSTFTNCGDDLLFDGHSYSTVLIGNQCWFSENCRYLPSVNSDSDLSSDAPKYYVHDYSGTDVTEAQADANFNDFGVLYNFQAVISGSMCPTNWSVPTDSQFTELIDFLGGDLSACTALKANTGWDGNGNGSNSSGFSGLPGGSIGNSNTNLEAYWWTSSVHQSSDGSSDSSSDDSSDGSSDGSSDDSSDGSSDGSSDDSSDGSSDGNSVTKSWMRLLNSNCDSNIRSKKLHLNGYSVRCVMN